MSRILRFLSFCTLFISFLAFGQNFQFELEGSFTTDNVPDPTSPATVNYTIQWNETSDSIQGMYSDNFYATTPRAVTGTITTLGRNFTVILPQVNNGVKEINVTTPETDVTTGTISVTVETENSVASPVDNVSSFALMSTAPIQIQTTDNNACTVGFGSLTGYCGLYSGTMTEISDPNDRCDLLMEGQPRLELATDTNFNLYLGYVNTLEDLPFHQLGTFVFSPQGNSINVIRRNCGALPGTSFLPGNCQDLNLQVVFYNQSGVLRFSGSYTITDTIANESCNYNVNVTREIPY